MSGPDSLDPHTIPREQHERRQLALELQGKAREAFGRGELQTATLYASDLLMLYPNERAYLETFDEIVQSTSDPLATLPVATGAIHVATAAGRARALMMQRRLPEAIELLCAAIEVAPHVPYFHWLQRWLSPVVIAGLSWELLFATVVKAPLTMALGVSVPPRDDDLRVINLRAAADVFAALRECFPTESILWYGEGLIRRRLGEPSRTVEIAEDGVERWPQDWRLRTGLLNAFRDAGRADDALTQARVALDIAADDLSPLHDVAWAFMDAERLAEAAGLFEELVEKDPAYPGARACMHFARWKANGSEEDKRVLVALRERAAWDDPVRGFADEADPPVPYVNVLVGPGDATLAAARQLASELEHVIRCCGVGGHVGLTLSSAHLDSPSVEVAFDLAMRHMGANGSLTYHVDQIQSPDPRPDKAQVSTPVWIYDGQNIVKAHAEGDARAQAAIASIARQTFRRDVWDPAAKAVADELGAGGYHALLSVLTNPPVPTDEDGFDAFTWTWRCQVATALALSHLGPWDTGSARAALYSMTYGPSDWVTSAAVIAFGWRVAENPAIRAEVEPIFTWLRSLIPATGFTTWEIVLADVWLGLEGHTDEAKADIEAWIDRYYETLPQKNVVRPAERRYADMSLEDYVFASIDGRVVPEWQEAMNASPQLHRRFLDLKRSVELEGMGVSAEEERALDQIHDGQMDMHLRVAQQQQAQREMNEGGGGDPDPEVFPGQAVARLSDYVSILKGMQSGDMNGALARYGLDMMSYGPVATAWSAKMAADPVLTEKFSRMMQP